MKKCLKACVQERLESPCTTSQIQAFTGKCLNSNTPYFKNKRAKVDLNRSPGTEVRSLSKNINLVLLCSIIN